MLDIDTRGVQRLAGYVDAYRETLNDLGMDGRLVDALVHDFQRQFLGALLSDGVGDEGLLFLIDQDRYITQCEQRETASKFHAEVLKKKVAEYQGKAG